ncbi:hypothetical protein QUB06_34270, partial [Microcoleus sp. D2_18a_D3]
TALKAVSHIKYPKMLSELCNDYLELSSVKWKRSGGRSWFEGLRFRTEGETSPTHSDSLSALIPQNFPTDTGLIRSPEASLDGNCSHLRGLEIQNISEKLESSSSLTEESRGTSHHFYEKLESFSGLIEESQITSHQSEIIEKVGLNPTNPVEIPEPLPDGNLSQPTNPAANPCEPLQTPHLELNEDELELVQMIWVAIAEPDPESARRTAADILPILKDVCARGAANREKVWAALTDSERAIFSELTAKPSAGSDNPQEPTPPQPVPEPEIIAPLDAEKLREIATVWWDEYYPAQLQTLITQMFGWGAPGTRYDAATIATWLASEDAVVRDRIRELIRRRSEGSC